MRLALALAALAGPAHALGCDDFWFHRNLVADRAGYCFSSPLGRTIFDNTDCTTTTPQLDPASADLIARIRALEAEWGCAVDTARTTVQVNRPDLYARLIDIPMPSPYESACVGWRGGPVPLRAGRSLTAPVLGHAEPGDSIGYSHEDAGGWSFVETGDGGPIGWVPAGTFDDPGCEMYAG